MVVKVHCGTVLGTNFPPCWKSIPQNSPTMYSLDNHLDLVSCATSKWPILLREMVIRMNKMITNKEMLWSLSTNLLGNVHYVWRSVWRICMWVLGLKGLNCVETMILTLTIEDTGAGYCTGVTNYHCHAFPLITWSTHDSIISMCNFTRFTCSHTPCKQSLLLDLGGEKDALPELHQSFDVTVAHLTIQFCLLWSNWFFLNEHLFIVPSHGY